jgi:hypothetical protein
VRHCAGALVLSIQRGTAAGVLSLVFAMAGEMAAAAAGCGQGTGDVTVHIYAKLSTLQDVRWHAIVCHSCVLP